MQNVETAMGPANNYISLRAWRPEAFRHGARPLGYAGKPSCLPRLERRAELSSWLKQLGQLVLSSSKLACLIFSLGLKER